MHWQVNTFLLIIKVLIIDTGVNNTHPDLVNVIDANVNYDEEGHGTGVAGVISAEINGLGIVGTNLFVF